MRLYCAVVSFVQALVLIVTLPALVHAQAPPMPDMPGMVMPPVDQGSVAGVVTKATGGAIAGATVTATNSVNKAQFSASTNVDGQYLLPSLPAGTYDVVVTLGGFETFRQAGVVIAKGTAQQINAALRAGGDGDRQALLDRIEELEKRLGDLESSAVLSEPETRVRRLDVYVDQNGIQYDQPTAGAVHEVTYQRERVYRRQTISEKIDEAMSAYLSVRADNVSVRLDWSDQIDARVSATRSVAETAADGTPDAATDGDLPPALAAMMEDRRADARDAAAAARREAIVVLPPSTWREISGRAETLGVIADLSADGAEVHLVVDFQVQAPAPGLSGDAETAAS